MGDIRHVAVSKGGMCAKRGAAEDAMLEITELAFLLKADGFPEPEIFKRIGRVHQPEPQYHSLPLGGDPVFYYLRDYLAAHFPDYLGNWTVFMSTVTVAQLWAELNAERMAASNWPPADMLSKPWSIRKYAGYADSVMGSANSKPEDFAQLS